MNSTRKRAGSRKGNGGVRRWSDYYQAYKIDAGAPNHAARFVRIADAFPITQEQERRLVRRWP